MSDKGIIFSAPMVRALLDGRKTQTRRILKTQPIEGARFAGIERDGQWLFTKGCHYGKIKPPYAPGDRLYVRETCRAIERASGLDQFQYRATIDREDEDAETVPNTPDAVGWGDLSVYGRGKRGRKNFAMPGDDLTFAGPWVPAIHAPRSTSRMFLTVTDVRVQRLQEMSTADALAEGVPCETCCAIDKRLCQADGCQMASLLFPDLWDSLHTKPGERWEDDPWIVAVSFDVHHGNIDAPK